MLSISSGQCRAARGLFAMTQQELASASGVSLRTIASFEDSSDRTPIPANVTAIRTALERLGVRFTAEGMEWEPPFSPAQIEVFKKIRVRHGQRILPADELRAATGCSVDELRLLARLGLVDGPEGHPILTAMGLHVPLLLQAHEHRIVQRQCLTSPLNYTVRFDVRTIFHALMAASYAFDDGGSVRVLFDGHAPPDARAALHEGAVEALRQERDRQARVTGRFVSR